MISRAVRVVVASALLAGAAIASPARADRPPPHAPLVRCEPPPLRRIELGARLGYAFPLGAIERGSRASDATYGGLPIAIDGEAVITPAWSLGALFSYALTIPTVCGSASDCVSSLGHDIDLLALVRFHLPPLPWLAPDIEAGLGWVWSSREVSDEGASSIRTFHGLLVHFALVPALVLSPHVTLGLAIGATFSIATHVALDAPGVSTSGAPDGPTLHGTFTTAVRVGVEL